MSARSCRRGDVRHRQVERPRPALLLKSLGRGWYRERLSAQLIMYAAALQRHRSSSEHRARPWHKQMKIKKSLKKFYGRGVSAPSLRNSARTIGHRRGDSPISFRDRSAEPHTYRAARRESFVSRRTPSRAARTSRPWRSSPLAGLPLPTLRFKGAHEYFNARAIDA
jgi:hypothetical protein